MRVAARRVRAGDRVGGARVVDPVVAVIEAAILARHDRSRHRRRLAGVAVVPGVAPLTLAVCVARLVSDDSGDQGEGGFTRVEVPAFPLRAAAVEVGRRRRRRRRQDTPVTRSPHALIHRARENGSRLTFGNPLHRCAGARRHAHGAEDASVRGVVDAAAAIAAGGRRRHRGG